MAEAGWDQCDFVLITGDAYVDHPSFGAAVIGRLLEADGFRVGILSQPDWTRVEPFEEFGSPRLAFLITSGNLDSMVNHYTAAGKPRREDAYSPGGIRERRPDRALIPYTSQARRAARGVPVILGGVEASLRRLAHYDVWSDKVRRSVLVDAKADLLVYGMGERAVREIARRLEAGEPISSLRDIPGTCYRCGSADSPAGLVLPSYEETATDKSAFVEAFRIQHGNTNPHSARPLIQKTGEQLVVQNPPALPLGGEDLDRIYQLPYTRRWHPSYDEAGGVPALAEVEFSLVSSRGCFGSCSFCSLVFHQGRIVTARTEGSLVEEARAMTLLPRFKGYIHDLGGPTANFFGPACARQEKTGGCPHRECLYPEPCPSLDSNHDAYLSILRKIRSLPGVKKLFIRSGIRYDHLLNEEKSSFLRELTEHHVSGQLKVAPEHASNKVLRLMGKPSVEVFTRFSREFTRMNRELGKKQYIIPYFISGHPGSTMKEAVELAEYLRDNRFVPDQVQDFYPTPGTRSTCMYHTGIDPLTGEAVHVPRGEEKNLQRALLHFHKPENAAKVRAALRKAGREDLIGRGPRCLVPPGNGGRESGERRGRRGGR